MSDNSRILQSQFQKNMRENSGLIIVTGGLLILMGMFAMGSPLAAGLSITVLVGMTLIIGGIGQFLFAFKTGYGVLGLVLGALTVVIGGYMVSQPASALGQLTIFLAVYLLASGAIEMMLSFLLRPDKGWVVVLISGVLSMLLGVMIWKQLPLSGVWAVGTLIGVRLFFNGVTLLTFGFAARK